MVFLLALYHRQSYHMKMEQLEFTFGDAELTAMSSGALYWTQENLLVVSDLHLGQADLVARGIVALLTPHQAIDTLSRLDNALAQTGAKTVICLGDSFDGLEPGQPFPEAQHAWITRMMAGRQWYWITGEHDAGPLEFGGTHKSEVEIGTLSFRHKATKTTGKEISGHYHPETTLVLKNRPITRTCFLYDEHKVVLPSFGAQTNAIGKSNRTSLKTILSTDNTRAILTGSPLCQMPMNW